MLSPSARALAAIIRGYLGAASGSGRGLARTLGQTHTTLIGWCRGTVPSADHLEGLLAALAVPERERVTARALRAAAAEEVPAWADAAAAVVWRSGAPAEVVADVIDALAAYCGPSANQCATTITPHDLRVIAANITQ